MTCKTLPHARATVRQVTAVSSSTLDQPAQLEQLAHGWHTLAAAYGPTEQWAWAASCLA